MGENTVMFISNDFFFQNYGKIYASIKRTNVYQKTCMQTETIEKNTPVGTKSKTFNRVLKLEDKI